MKPFLPFLLIPALSLGGWGLSMYGLSPERLALPAVLPGYDSRFVPLHVYLNRALDAMYAHLDAKTALPPSQVIRTVPRGGTPGAAPALTPTNLPAISAQPAAADRITVGSGSVVVPD